MKTYMASASTIERKWYVVDAADYTLGRLASQVAAVLRGKNKPTYTPFLDCGDNVIVINADKVKVTGKKLDQKVYYSHSDYVGGLKETTLKEMMEKKPEKVIDAIQKLAKFYGVSTDYLLGLTEQKNHSDVDVASLHLSDEVLELLRSGKINNRLLCEMMTHPRFRQLMADIEIVVDRIADMRIQDMNTVLEVARQKVMKEYAPDEMDVYMRTLEVAQINETDYFSYIIHEDMDEITETIRENHRKDTTTADETTPAQDGIKVLMHSILDQKDETTVLLKQLCAQMQIPEEKITEEEVRAFRSMMQKSRLFKKQMSMRGKGGHANKRR